MVYTNKQLYQFALEMKEFILNDTTTYFPSKVSFYILKNTNILQPLVEEIEKIRFQIAQTYGALDEETGAYKVPEENMEQAEKELNSLFEATQEVEFYKISYAEFENINLTLPQTQALMFMIEE